jgi:hypothetical protein
MSDLSRWSLAHFELLHDFAAPVATVIGAATAVVVTGIITWTLGKWQVEIARQQAKTAELQATTAKQQADTALDRLRYDLFEKRYAVYRALTELLTDICDETIKADLHIDEKIAKFLLLEEARFFFPPDTMRFVLEIRQRCDWIMTRYARHRTSKMSDPDLFPLPQDLWDAASALRQELISLPQRFERDLGFAHVLRGSTDR